MAAVYKHIDIITESLAYRKLESERKSGLIKHAYVFESGDFGALDTLARLFVCLCEKGGADEAMLKRIRDGGYLDIVRLPKPESKGKITVDDISQAIDSAYLTPTELSSKYYIFASPDGLSPAVQNKMLKTLEEPPRASRFIIFTQGNDLLPTVLSRCATVRLEPFGDDVIIRSLVSAGYDEVTALFLAAVSRGNIGTAEEIASDRTYMQAYEEAANFLLSVKRSSQILPTAAKFTAAKEKFVPFIDYLELILRDIMAYREVGAEAVVLKPALSDIVKLSREFDTVTVLKLLPLIRHARERIRLYGNAASYIDELLFSILEVKAKCRT